MSLGEKLRNTFNISKTEKHIKIGDIGVYINVHSFSSGNEISGEKHEVFSKVEVIKVYEGLVEVKVIDYDFSGSVNECLNETIKLKDRKFIEPKHIKWEIK